jgi:hypothetical protein
MAGILLLLGVLVAVFAFLGLDERGQRLNAQQVNAKLTKERDEALTELEKQKAAINSYLAKPVQISLSDLQLELIAHHVAEKIKEVDKRLVN